MPYKTQDTPETRMIQKIVERAPGELIFLGYRGSISHGTHVPSDDEKGIDDIDLIGVFVAPEDHYLGSIRTKETIEIVDGDWDVVLYELKHFFKLLYQQNPNVLSTLWLKPEHIIKQGFHWELMVRHRWIWATKKAYRAFEGYAKGQLKKMTSMPDATEDRDREIKEIKQEIQRRETDAPLPFQTRGKSFLLTTSTQELRTRVNALKGQTGYMGEKRKRMVMEHGYDTKNAAHMLRLLYMCIEFLDTGEMQVDRTNIDAAFLIDIKNGMYNLTQIEKIADLNFGAAKEAVGRSTLPEEPDPEKSNALLKFILRDQLFESRQEWR